MSDSFQRAALAAVEGVINRALELDPATRRRLQSLAGHRFRLACTQPAIAAVLGVQEDGLTLGTGDSDARLTTEVTGSLSEFIDIATAEDPAAALINGDVRVSGDTAPLLELRDILADLDIDWEQPLSRVFGDVAGHQLGRTLRAGQRWAGRALQQFRRQFREFVVEESELLPHPIQVEDFYREIEALAAGTDRLQARVQRLRQRVQARTGNGATGGPSD